MFGNTGPYTTGPAAAELARTAEDTGFESIWAIEHVVVPKGYESKYPYGESGRLPSELEESAIPDPMVWLAYVAAVTERINLATGIMILPQRNPLVTAKVVASVDHMSGGRVRLGIGVGWLQEEFDALGVPFERRGARTDDYIAAMRALWTQDCASHEGEFTSFRDVYCRPQPVNGTVPIIVGGHTERAARRAGELGDGFFPGRGGPSELARLFRIVRETAERCGRDPDAIELTTGGKTVPSYVDRLAEIGVHRMIVAPGSLEDVASLGELIAQYS
jgi:probable F420-dependent oxidoreductase